MQYAPNIVAEDPDGLAASPALSAFILYESVAAGKKAKEVCDLMKERLGPGWKIELEMYSFDALRFPQLRGSATVSVAHANLVIFSCGHDDFPVEVGQWTESWLTTPVRPAALVALLTSVAGQNEEPGATEQYLATVASLCGMDYFSHSYVPAAGTETDSTQSFWTKGTQ